MSENDLTNAIPIEILKSRLKEIALFSSASYVLQWDQEVHMPKKAVEYRAKTLSELSALIHQKYLALDRDKLLTLLKENLEKGKYADDEEALILETWRNYEQRTKLPEAHVRELSELTSNAQHHWAEARKQSDFSLFLPWLEKMIFLQKKTAKYLGYKKSPYDALLDVNEPGMTADKASKILNDVKDFLIPFLLKIKKSKIKVDAKKTKGEFPILNQIGFNLFVAKKIGYDLEAGKIDSSTHPFTITFHQTDVRFTTRFKENDALYALGSTIHETGHALYEQGLTEEDFGTPLGEAISLGIHESQSRMWENNIGKSLDFWKYFYPKLQKEFPKPFKKLPMTEFYKIVNKVTPSFIRTEADEVTYNLHIIMRFEIEKELMEGTLEAKNAPKVWNQKMQKYLGVKVPSDRLGILQDVHWSGGLFGYFPTYSFGNLYAAQFYAAMLKDIPDLAKRFARGEFLTAREWLRNKIHVHGKRYTADELVLEVTGESLNSKYFQEYLIAKYSKIYNLK